ncbi:MULTISPECIES: acyl-CoA dehydrogenase family protein [unclassified Azospirillum]|uniref:acyl-CoA dehydrogenase family protein n=1 Tax=unclassified Azospirillum TaxID=2630922 RepID=UPI000B64947C|nr:MULTISPECIES: acyl-CoA dehydrogenase family protein [unclassified Azospirillum]SNT08006.1 Acyl-CoA dehydrogenase [Azospirillum sp. RU38E]SNT22684.1 Acyl-CoA dehydrogenase [Azospirillum sp. RU37A]
MELGFGAAYEAFRAEVRTFIAAHWPPADGNVKDPAAIRAFRDACTAQGYYARAVPRRYGGSEQPADIVKAEIIREEIRRADAPAEVRDGGITLLIPTLLEWGTEAQRQRFISPTLKGDYRWAQGFSEPGAGSDLASLRTRAVLVDDHWVINGQKIWSSYAHRAHYMFALVRTEPEAPKHEGISYLLIDLRQPGVTIRPLRQMTDQSEFCEVFFDDARTPADWIVGGRGQGWRITRTTLKHERGSLSGLSWTDSMLRGLIRLAREMRRDGQPAIDHPTIRAELAAIEAQSMALTYSTYRAISMTVHGQEPGLFSTMAKIASTDLAQRIAKLARDLLADDLLVMDGPQRKWIDRFMISLSMSIAGGTSNIQRNIIAERGLGLPREQRAGEA